MRHESSLPLRKVERMYRRLSERGDGSMTVEQVDLTHGNGTWLIRRMGRPLMLVDAAGAVTIFQRDVSDGDLNAMNSLGLLRLGRMIAETED